MVLVVAHAIVRGVPSLRVHYADGSKAWIAAGSTVPECHGAAVDAGCESQDVPVADAEVPRSSIHLAARVSHRALQGTVTKIEGSHVEHGELELLPVEVGATSRPAEISATHEDEPPVNGASVLQIPRTLSRPRTHGNLEFGDPSVKLD